MDYIISDNHWFHGNILKFENRAFGSTHEMDEYMIDQWNSVVSKNDLVYHLGDIAFTNNFVVLMKLLHRLNGKIYLMLGNHDHSCQRKGLFPKRFKWIDDKLFIGDVITEKKVNISGKYEKVSMCHYPMASWNAKFHGRKSFYGHVHSQDEVMQNTLNSFNVCVDVIGYKPMTFKQVIDFYT